VNDDMVELEPIDATEAAELLEFVTRHRDFTGSPVAGRIVDAWDTELAHFRKVMPRDYKRVLAVIKQAQIDGLDEEATNARVMASV